MGLASCPITEPLEVAETREVVRADIFGDSFYPQMLLRVGWAPINADPLPSTPRRELADVVQWMTDCEPDTNNALMVQLTDGIQSLLIGNRLAGRRRVDADTGLMTPGLA